jgi:hypothetical protein
MNKEEQAKYIIQQLGIKLPDKYIGGKYGEDDLNIGPNDITEIPLDIERNILSFLDIKNKKDVKTILNYASVNKTALERYTKGGEYIEGLKSSIIYEFVDIYKMFNGDFTKGDTEFIRSVSYNTNKYGDKSYLEFLKKKSKDTNKLIYLFDDKYHSNDQLNEMMKYLIHVKDITLTTIPNYKDMKVKKLNVDVIRDIENFNIKTLESFKIGFLQNKINKYKFYENLINNNKNLKELKIDADYVNIETLKLFKDVNILQCGVNNINNMDVLFENDDTYNWNELDITIRIPPNEENLQRKKKNFNVFLKNIKTLKTLKIKINVSPLYDSGFTTQDLNIEYLKFTLCSIDYRDLSGLKYLKYLKLEKNIINKIENFMNMEFKNVKYLYLNNEPDGTDNTSIIITRFMNLDTLHLITTTIQSNIEKYQKTFENIKFLEISHCEMNDEIFKYLKNINELILRHSKISSETLIYILKNTNIKKLTLVYCNKVDDLISEYMNDLIYLKIYNCRFITEGIFKNIPKELHHNIEVYDKKTFEFKFN